MNDAVLMGQPEGAFRRFRRRLRETFERIELTGIDVLKMRIRRLGTDPMQPKAERSQFANGAAVHPPSNATL